MMNSSTLRRNVVANSIGQGWVALMAIAFIPLYIKYLGIEAYGLIGIYAILQAWLALLDMGMTPALSREMALFTGGRHDSKSIRDLLRSVEIVGFSLAVLVALGVYFSSAWLASNWLKSESLPVQTVSQAFAIMGLVTALRFVENIYRSSIVGLQRQVLLNKLLVVIATIRWAGAAGIVVWVSPTIESFFIWQGLVSVGSVISFSIVVYTTLPASPDRARFSLVSLMNIWRFAAGMLAINVLSIFLTQADKMMLSSILPLKEFGYYVLAATVAGGLYMLAGPISQACYPKFSELIASGDEKPLISLYHKSSQLITVLVGSVGLVLFFFSDVVIYLWSGDALLVSNAAYLVSVLALGTLLHCFLGVPYLLQLANGYTALSVKLNLITLIIFIPTLLLVAQKYGATGAAWAWVVLNGGNVVFGIHFMHKYFLKNEKWRWYLEDIGMPIAGAAISAYLLRLAIPVYSFGWLGQFASLLLVLAIAFFSATITSPILRHQVVVYMFKFTHQK